MKNIQKDNPLSNLKLTTRNKILWKYSYPIIGLGVLFFFAVAYFIALLVCMGLRTVDQRIFISEDNPAKVYMTAEVYSDILFRGEGDDFVKVKNCMDLCDSSDEQIFEAESQLKHEAISQWNRMVLPYVVLTGAVSIITFLLSIFLMKSWNRYIDSNPELRDFGFGYVRIKKLVGIFIGITLLLSIAILAFNYRNFTSPTSNIEESLAKTDMRDAESNMEWYSSCYDEYSGKYERLMELCNNNPERYGVNLDIRYALSLFEQVGEEYGKALRYYEEADYRHASMYAKHIKYYDKLIVKEIDKIDDELYYLEP